MRVEIKTIEDLQKLLFKIFASIIISTIIIWLFS